MYKIFSVCCLYMVSLCGWSQEESRIRLIGLEAGADAILGEVPEHDYIRAEVSYYGESEKNLQSLAYKFYGGVKTELRSRNNTFGFSGGLRFSRIVTSLGKGSSYYTTSDFFYFMVEQTDNSMEYLKVREINEASSYIGIPLAVSWAPFGQHLFTVYFKGGLELNYRVNTKTTVEFVDPAMDQYNDEVVDRLRDSQKFNSILSTYGGIKIGRNPKVAFSLEAGPSVFLTDNTSRIVDVTAGFGVQLNLHLTL